MDLFSTSLAPFTGTIINPLLLSTLAELQALRGGTELTLLEFDTNRIAIPISVPVSLPTLGNSNSLDIRELEPVIIVFDISKYPWKAPISFPDRLGFPIDRLSHFYIATKDRPPAFCLTRESMDEWYANKTIADYITRIRNWYRDAAAGVLNENGDQFEPFRLVYSGSLIYDYDLLAGLVDNPATTVAEGNFALLLMEYFKGGDGSYGWKFLKVITDENFDENNKLVQSEADKPVEDKHRRLLFYGLIVWSEAATIVDHYKIEIPTTWDEFKRFCGTYDISTDNVERYILAFEHHRYKGMPIIAAIRRPKPLIGYTSSIELINFSVLFDDGQRVGNNIDPNVVISLHQHLQPITPKKAEAISGFVGNIPELSIIAGLGALGSRVGAHLVKAGARGLIVCDIDKLVPHNFVRHPLSTKFTNFTKGLAFAIEMNNTVSGAGIVSPGKVANEVIDIISDANTNLNILDFTASETFQNYLINNTRLFDSSICSASITDFGNLGLLFFEGKGRNPRLDDLQVLLYNTARENSRLADWMNREVENASKTESINVGVGCNSETTVLSEDIVAAHASFITGNIKLQSLSPSTSKGLVFTNAVDMNPYFHFESSSMEFAPLELVAMENDNSWQVRIVKHAAEKIRQQTAKASPVETGGVMIGRANYKTRTVHVVDVIDAPADSMATETCFHRGKQGLAEQIDKVIKCTGGQLGYIGDWHSHPKGPDGASQKDVDTLKELRSEYDLLPTKFPAFILIATAERFIPYIL